MSTICERSRRAHRRVGTCGGIRDTKDLRFGMGMASMRVNSPDRRDRLWLLNAFAIALLTLLGAAGEALGYDRHLKLSTPRVCSINSNRTGRPVFLWRTVARSAQ
jgi:hypothetical protein